MHTFIANGINLIHLVNEIPIAWILICEQITILVGNIQANVFLAKY